MHRLHTLHGQQANAFAYLAGHDAQMGEERQIVVGPAYSQGQITFGHVASQLDAVALVGVVVKAKWMDAGQHCSTSDSDRSGLGMDMANQTEE